MGERPNKLYPFTMSQTCIDCHEKYPEYDDLNWVPNPAWTTDECCYKTICRCGCGKIVSPVDLCGRCRSCQMEYKPPVEIRECALCKKEFPSTYGIKECNFCKKWMLHECNRCMENYLCATRVELNRCFGCKCPCTNAVAP